MGGAGVLETHSAVAPYAAPPITTSRLRQLCPCARSCKGWFFDRAHPVSGRVSYGLRLSEPATVPLRECGRSHRYPLSDGRHDLPVRRAWRRRG